MRSTIIAGLLGAVFLATAPAVTDLAAAQSPPGRMAFDASADARQEKIEPYRPRFGRRRPVIAVVGSNAGTEITDFVIPFGVLSRSEAAEVVSVAVAPGPVRMAPLRFQLQSTLADFDRRFPDGADYVVIPKVDDEQNPLLLKWLAAQAGKGGTIVSICLGANVVANAGLLDGYRATAWWGTEADRIARYPKVRWSRNVRYVADGKRVSSAGVSASMPISIALVEAIAGHARAAALAEELGIGDWSPVHDSDYFHQTPMVLTRSGRETLEAVGIPVAAGMDEIALALTAEAYSINGKSMALAVAGSRDPVQLAQGLVVLPDQAGGDARPLARLLPLLSAHRPAMALDRSLAEIAAAYGHAAAWRVAQIMEYPGFRREQVGDDER